MIFNICYSFQQDPKAIGVDSVYFDGPKYKLSSIL